jgi:thiol-disulfide isomerase/thioredoxin
LLVDSRKWTWVVVIVIIIAVFFALRSCREVQKPPTYSDFSLSALDGSVVTLSQFEGKMPVLLVFGATWCPSCKEEIPLLKQVHKEFSGRIKLLYVDVQESQQKVAAYVEEHKIPYTVLLDINGDVARDYGVNGIPLNIVADINGDIVFNLRIPRCLRRG